ncbi:MAG: anti-sigma factor family protein [Myxococcales bacterium]
MVVADCQRVRSEIDPYRDGELPPVRREEVEGHLKSCPDCAAQLADRQALGGLLRLRAEVVGESLPSGFAERVLAALPLLPASRRAVGRRGLLLGFLAAAAVTAAIVLPLVGQPLRRATRAAAENEAHIHRLSVTGTGPQPLVFQNDLGQTVVWMVADQEAPSPVQ